MLSGYCRNQCPDVSEICIYNVNDCFLIKEGINGSLILQFSESNKTKKYIIMHFKRSTINTKCVLDNKDVKNFKNAIWK